MSSQAADDDLAGPSWAPPSRMPTQGTSMGSGGRKVCKAPPVRTMSILGHAVSVEEHVVDSFGHDVCGKSHDIASSSTEWGKTSGLSTACNDIIREIIAHRYHVEEAANNASDALRAKKDAHASSGIALLAKRATHFVMQRIHMLASRMVRGTGVADEYGSPEEEAEWVSRTETALIYAIIEVNMAFGNLILIFQVKRTDKSNPCTVAYLHFIAIPASIFIVSLMISFGILGLCKPLGISYKDVFQVLVVINATLRILSFYLSCSVHPAFMLSASCFSVLPSIGALFLLPRHPATLLAATCLLIFRTVVIGSAISRAPGAELHNHRFSIYSSSASDSDDPSHYFACIGNLNNEMLFDVPREILSFLVVSSLILAALRRFCSQHIEIQRRTDALKARSEAMSRRNDALLRSLFPPGKAAQVLKQASTRDWYKSECDVHDDVSVLQVDIMGFTALSTILTAEELFDIVNTIFSSIDSAAEIIGGLFKVETIGDCYKAVSGGLIPCEDHAERAAGLGYAIIEIVKVVSRRLGLPQLSVRVGVATGPLVAAFVGEICPRYFIYGEASQEAGRMETSAEAGRLHVTLETSLRLCGLWEIEEARDGSPEYGANVSPVGNITALGHWVVSLGRLLASLNGLDLPQSPRNHSSDGKNESQSGTIQRWACKAVQEAESGEVSVHVTSVEWAIMSAAMPGQKMPGNERSSISMLTISGVMALAHSCIRISLGAGSYIDALPGASYACLSAALAVSNAFSPVGGSRARLLRMLTSLLLFLSPLAFFVFGRGADANLSTTSLLWSFMGVLMHGSSSRKVAGILFFVYSLLVVTVGVLHHMENIFADSANRDHNNNVASDLNAPLSTLEAIMTKAFIAINIIGSTTAFFVAVAIELQMLYAQKAIEAAGLIAQQLHEEAQDSILGAIVPAHICNRLKAGERFISCSHEEATVMFVYIDRYEEMLKQHGPEETVGWIRRVFCELDQAMSAQGDAGLARVTKIESFNNFYMTVCGLEGEGRSVEASVRMAVNLSIAGTSVTRPDGSFTSLKIGMHCGALSSGVVGIKSPRFSVFGETVNTAARAASIATASTFFRTSISMSEQVAVSIPPEMAVKLAACNLFVTEIGLQELRGKGCASMWEMSPASKWKQNMKASFHMSLTELASELPSLARATSRPTPASPWICGNDGPPASPSPGERSLPVSTRRERNRPLHCTPRQNVQPKSHASLSST